MFVAPFIQAAGVWCGIANPIATIPEGWKWLYYANGCSMCMRTWLVPQFEDTNTEIDVVGTYNVPGGALEGQVGVTSQVPVSTWVLGRLGTSSAAESFGWMVLIMSGAVFLNMVFYQTINWTVR